MSRRGQAPHIWTHPQLGWNRTMFTLLYGAVLVAGFAACLALLGGCARLMERG
jgi:hypothetical protein